MASPGPPDEQQAAAAAIEAQEQDASAPQILLDGYGCRVKRRPGNLVVKHGRSVTVAEREALAYAGTLSLPAAPETEATEKAGAGGDGVSIWMDYVDGAVLEDVWPDMTAEQKMDVARQLRAILEEMRRQTSPLGAATMIASCGGGALSDRRTYNVCHGGPFADEAAFDAFQLDVYKPTPREVRDALARALEQQQRSKQHRVVFTHGDLTQFNIIVDKDSYRIRALLDWEYAGWYPEH